MSSKMSKASSAPRSASDIFSLTGRVVLVVGASSGLGAHFARVLAGAGPAAVLLAARRVEKLEDLAAQIRIESPCVRTVATVPLDVSDTRSIKDGVDAAEQKAGSVVDVLINCAGIANPKLALETDEADWDELMAVNLKGNFFCAKEVAQRLVAAARPGNIVNVASILALRPGTLRGAHVHTCTRTRMQVAGRSHTAHRRRGLCRQWHMD